MPSVNVVNGKQIVVEDSRSVAARRSASSPSPSCRCGTIGTSSRRSCAARLRERFKGSAGGWVWAVVAPLLAIAVYTFAFTTNLQLPLADRRRRARGSAYALFIFSGIIVFNFFSEMAFRAPMLLHEYAHFIKQTIFPSDMLAVISTLRATLYTGISVVVMLIFQLVVTGGLPWTVRADPADLPAASWRS